ncbi:MAG: hypothetical protein R3231_09985, partial [bacterium]|nr:hypothetical protein [bacterium]
MDFAMLQLANLLNGQTGSVQRLESTGEPGFFALTLQSLVGELPGPGIGETGVPWGQGTDLASQAAFLPWMSEGLTSRDPLLL